MNTKNKNDIGLKVWKAVAGNYLSPSHDSWHIDRVLKFALQLHQIYGGDEDIIIPSVILHDLGRSDPNKRGDDSIKVSIKISENILKSIDLPERKIKKILLAISEHDKPEFRPTTIEGRILKDADFLAGFGAWGILRIAMWAGETGSGVTQIINRLEDRMYKRLENLEFEESVNWAKKETLFTVLFYSMLGKNFDLTRHRRAGKYIVLEGISGSGKDTQAKLLKTKLENKNYIVTIVKEPSDFYRRLRGILKEFSTDQVDDLTFSQFILLADRFKIISEQVTPLLNKGEIVISVRSYISTLVYQKGGELDESLLLYIHKFVPIPDLILLYDLNAEVAIERIEKRDREIGEHESLNTLKEHRKRYKQSINRMRLLSNKLEIIDASTSEKIIVDQSYEAIKLSLKK